MVVEKEIFIQFYIQYLNLKQSNKCKRKKSINDYQQNTE